MLRRFSARKSATDNWPASRCTFPGGSRRRILGKAQEGPSVIVLAIRARHHAQLVKATNDASNGHRIVRTKHCRGCVVEGIFVEGTTEVINSLLGWELGLEDVARPQQGVDRRKGSIRLQFY